MNLKPILPGSCMGCRFLPNAFYCNGDVACASKIEKLRINRRVIAANRLIYREGEQAHEFYIIFEGWAFRYKLLADGRRQILSFLMPGDPISVPFLIMKRAEFFVQSLTALSLCVFSRDEFADYISEHPTLSRKAERLCAQATAAAEERLLDVGRRSAYERVGRLLLEISIRLQERGLSSGHTASLPIGQVHIADALGLTAIHVGRVLQQLRADGILTFQRGQLHIHDIDHLTRI